ncbi:hypothetical protein M422DRAFT_263403 [Sphaerobolus stellatus SS14]|uniref:Uncharacterized protein n=1 Tax=Sphaerobolus stellatus (strain SS14) TaxID=990650 RepID=A0A0C9TVV5_SPHS4|nr:hypothetical protein M422DRAFT_263403 [Sphaerobolus stellatus SS14]
MSTNTSANNTSFSFLNPPTADRPSISKAGTIRPASDRSPFERRDPAKKPKAVDLEEYLNKDIDLPPSPTRTTTRSATLLGADILGDTSKRKEPSTLSNITIPHLPSASSMSQSGSTTAPADTTTQVPPQDQATVGSSDTDHHPVTTYALNPPPPERLPADIRNRFIAPVGTGWYPIHGQTLERLMFPITPNHQRDWKSLDGNKTLAVISRLKVTRNAADRVATMSALERLLAMAFPGNAAIDVVLGDTIQAHVHPNSAYPFLVQGLTDRETRILKNEFVLAHEEIAVFFYPYDTALPITNYALSLEGLVLTPSSANDTRAAAELVCFLSTAGEFIQFINQNHSNIPFDAEPNSSNFVRWILNTLQVTSSVVKRRNTGPVLIHNVFIHPPTIEPAAYKEWISLLHRLHYDTRKGTGKPTTAELCNVCKSVAHSDDACKYAAVPGWPAAAPSPPSPPPQPYSAHIRGGGHPHGRGRGGISGRGRGGNSSVGWV